MADFEDLEDLDTTFTNEEIGSIITYDDPNYTYDDIGLTYDGVPLLDWSDLTQVDTNFTDINDVP